MASAHKIRMDFELAKRQAQRLEEVAGKMDRIADGQMAGWRQAGQGKIP